MQKFKSFLIGFSLKWIKNTDRFCLFWTALNWHPKTSNKFRRQISHHIIHSLEFTFHVIQSKSYQKQKWSTDLNYSDLEMTNVNESLWRFSHMPPIDKNKWIFIQVESDAKVKRRSGIYSQFITLSQTPFIKWECRHSMRILRVSVFICLMSFWWAFDGIWLLFWLHELYRRINGHLSNIVEVWVANGRENWCQIS